MKMLNKLFIFALTMLTAAPLMVCVEAVVAAAVALPEREGGGFTRPSGATFARPAGGFRPIRIGVRQAGAFRPSAAISRPGITGTGFRPSTQISRPGLFRPSGISRPGLAGIRPSTQITRPGFRPTQITRPSLGLVRRPGLVGRPGITRAGITRPGLLGTGIRRPGLAGLGIRPMGLRTGVDYTGARGGIGLAGTGQFQRLGRAQFADRRFARDFGQHWNKWWGNKWDWHHGGNWWWGHNWWLSPWFWWGNWWNPWWAYYIDPIPVYTYQTYVTDYRTLPVQERRTKFDELLALVLAKLDELQKGNDTQIQALNSLSSQIDELGGQQNAQTFANQANRLIDRQESQGGEIDRLANQTSAIQSQYTGTESQVQQLLNIAQSANSLIESQKKQSEEVGRLSNDVFTAQHNAGLVNIPSTGELAEDEEPAGGIVRTGGLSLQDETYAPRLRSSTTPSAIESE